MGLITKVVGSNPAPATTFSSNALALTTNDSKPAALRALSFLAAPDDVALFSLDTDIVGEPGQEKSPATCVAGLLLTGGASGIRTPDLRIMIPSL